MENSLKKSIKTYALIFKILAFTFVGFLMSLYLSNNIINQSIPIHLQYIKVILLTLFIGLIIDWFSDKLNNYFSWHTKFFVRFTSGFFASAIITLIALTILELISSLFSKNDSVFTSYSYDLNNKLFKISIILFVIIFVYQIVYFSIYSFSRYNYIQLQNRKNKLRQQELHFDALSNQLKPHYLFNNLNTISSLIYSDKLLAEKYIRRFVTSFDYVLKNGENMLVKLNQEIEFIKNYTFLLQVRFGNMLHLDINIGENSKKYNIPPLSLQLLIENAVKHNPMKNKEQLKITIYTINEKIVVENNIIEKPMHITINNQLIENKLETKSLKLGLKMLKARFRYFTSEDIKIEKNKSFKVTLPLIKK